MAECCQLRDLQLNTGGKLLAIGCSVVVGCDAEYQFVAVAQHRDPQCAALVRSAGSDVRAPSADPSVVTDRVPQARLLPALRSHAPTVADSAVESHGSAMQLGGDGLLTPKCCCVDRSV